MVKIDNITLNPDQNWARILYPDPNSMYSDLTGDQALLAGVQVEVVEGVVDGLDLPHLDEPDLGEILNVMMSFHWLVFRADIATYFRFLTKQLNRNQYLFFLTTAMIFGLAIQ